MTIQRMDNVGIVVDDLDAAIAFFTELGMELEGRMPIEGSWAGNVVGLDDMRSEIAMMRIPGVPGRLELAKYRAPQAITPTPEPVRTRTSTDASSRLPPRWNVQISRSLSAGPPRQS